VGGQTEFAKQFVLVKKWWLQDFAFSVGVKIFSFLWAGILVMLIAWFTISFQSFKAAVSNPIKAIKAD
jgi:putative ABC transport system permease protein